MADISELVISIRTDGVEQASSRIDILIRREREAERETKKMSDSFAAFNLIVNRLPGPLKTAASALMGLVSPAQAVASILLDLGEAAVNFAKESLTAFSDFEMIKANLEIVMGSAARASAAFDELRSMAGRTPFDVEGLAGAAVQLKQTGTAAQDLIPVLTMLGNTAGGSAEKFNRLVANYAQIQSVGKTTAMDLKQFAMMGIPIYEVLQKIGVEGNATASQIKTAFQEMTKEGGTFYNAMEKGAETLQGKTTNLQGVWKAFLATFAETSGLADVWKEILDIMTRVIVNQTESMSSQKALNDAVGRIMSGTGTAGDYLLEFKAHKEKEKRELERLIREREFESNAYGYSEAGDETLKGYREELRLLEEMIRPYQALIAAEEARASFIEETNRKFEEANRTYAAGIADIDAKYAQTQQGRVEALQAEINKYREYLNLKRQEKINIPGGGVQIATYGMGEEEKKKIEAIIELLDEQLKNAIKTSKAELKDWQKVLKQALSVEDVSTEAKAVEEFTARIRKEETAIEPISRLLGLDKLGQYEDVFSRIRNGLAVMLPTAIWKEDEKIIRDLLSLFDEYEKKVKEQQELKKQKEIDESYAEEIRSLGRELELLQMTNAERKKALFFDEKKKKGYSEPQIDNLYAEQQKADDQKKINNSREYVAGLEHQLELLKMSREEREKQILIDQGLTPEYAAQAVEIQKQIKLLETLEQTWENVKRQLLEIGAGGFVDMMREIGKAFQDGALSADEMSNALSNYVRKIIQAIPQLLLQAGLQLMTTGNWQVGLALIAASGLASFVSGLMESDDAGKQADDTLEQLRRLQGQITQLIDAQKEQAEYYLQKQRSISAGHNINTYSVNDAIITPGGIVNTAPDDYILAMKHPETLMSGNAGTVVNVNVINNSSAQVEVQENSGGGLSEILVMIKNDIKRDFASGGFDGAYDAMRSRRGGIRRNA
jgi:hypothetical protein